MVITQKNLYTILCVLFAIILSVILFPLYVNGDQIAYRGFFENCLTYEKDIKVKWYCYNGYLGSKEPGYFLIMNYLGSVFGGFYLNVIFNGFLVYLISVLVCNNIKSNIERVFILLLMITNFYVLVLFFSAERLKFAFVFFMAFLVFRGVKQKIFIIFSLLTHVQILILFISFYIRFIYDSNLSILRKNLINFIASVFLFLFLVFNKNHLIYKINVYSTLVQEVDSGFLSLLKVSVIYFITLFSYPRLSVILAGIPILISAYFLGSSRIMMLMFLFYFFVIILLKKKTDILFYLILFYFSFKSFDFILNIISYGDGFNLS